MSIPSENARKSVILKLSATILRIQQIYTGDFLSVFPSQILELSKKITKEANETVALKKIKAILESEDQYHGSKKFPENESNSEAHARCIDDKSAKKYCPTRWKSIHRWAKVSCDSLLNWRSSNERTKMSAKQNLYFQTCFSTGETVWVLELALNTSF